MSIAKCRTCPAYIPWDKGGHGDRRGDCRVLPPYPGYQGVREGDWCMQHPYNKRLMERK